jgi:amino acid adenylation domain-containing protein
VDFSPTLELVRAQVLARPDAPAIFEVDGSVLTFAELWSRAGELADRLDLEFGEIAGVCLARSAEVVVAMMAVMMCGGVYAPFSPDDPALRTENLQTRIGVRRVITSDGQRTVVESREVADAPLLDMSGDPADRPIYVMWTSGSTGEPKAVVVPHRGVLRLIRDRDFVDIGTSDRLAFASNPMFDAATWEIWVSLANGAGLVVISPEDLVDARRLRERFEDTGVTRTFLTTSLFNHLVRSDPGMFGSLTSVAVGGESLNAAAMRTVLESGSSPTALLNAYGPTECTTFACWRLIEHVPVDAPRIPIGGPLIETELAVVDEHGHPVPGDEEGELWIAGTGVALGYFGWPPEMARFVDTTLPGHRGDRWYRTGDLVRRLPDGALDCFGRIDRQVKIHGYRIEPSEIEGAISERPGVSAASVIAVRSGSSVSLVGFLVAGREVDPDAIQRALRQSLPHYMVPARLIVVDHLPITANGKLDEERLRLIALTAPPTFPEDEVDDDQIADPQFHATNLDPVEEFVLECARAILGNSGLQVDDDLWVMGLDSLSAIELLDTINGADYGRFDTPEFDGLATAAELAQVLRATPVDRVATAEQSTIVTLNQAGSSPPIFVVPGVAGTSAKFTHLARGLGADQPVMVIGPSGMHRPGPVHRSIEELAGHVCSEIAARISPGDPCVLVGYSAGASVAFEAAGVLDARGVDVRLVILDAIPGVVAGERLEQIRPLEPVIQRPSFNLRVRQRGVGATVRRLPAAMRARRRVKYMDRLYAQPGPPSFEHDRYRVFARIQMHAIEAYRPEPSGLRATLIRVDQGPIELLADGLFANLDVHVVGGNHLTMLDQLHVPEIVEVLRAVIAAVD